MSWPGCVFAKQMCERVLIKVCWYGCWMAWKPGVCHKNRRLQTALKCTNKPPRISGAAGLLGSSEEPMQIQ